MEIAVIAHCFGNIFVANVWYISIFTKYPNNRLTFFPLPPHLSLVLVIPEWKTLLVLVLVVIESMIILRAISSGGSLIKRLLVTLWSTNLSGSESIRKPSEWGDIPLFSHHLGCYDIFKIFFESPAVTIIH